MDAISIILAIVFPVLMAWFGSLEWRLRNMSNKTSKAMDRDDTEKLIDLKQEVLYVLHREIKDNIKEINKKMDRLID
jgi:hypothetical protein